MSRFHHAFLVAALTALPVHAAPVDLNSLTLNGDASIATGNLELTVEANSEVGSAFTSAYALSGATPFSAFFEFMIAGSGAPADGLTFTVQNDIAGANELGSAGGYLGYFGIRPSVAVEFDTYSNGVSGTFNDPNANHIGINQNGSLASLVTGTPAFTLANGASRFAWVDYDGATLSVFAAETNAKPGSAILSQAFDLSVLGAQAYFGFTAATGGLNSQHLIKQFDLTVGTPAVPVPPALPLVASAFGLMGLYRRKRAA